MAEALGYNIEHSQDDSSIRGLLDVYNETQKALYSRDAQAIKYQSEHDTGGHETVSDPTIIDLTEQRHSFYDAIKQGTGPEPIATRFEHENGYIKVIVYLNGGYEGLLYLKLSNTGSTETIQLPGLDDAAVQAAIGKSKGVLNPVSGRDLSDDELRCLTEDLKSITANMKGAIDLIDRVDESLSPIEESLQPFYGDS